jgi:hypothetical protein
MQALRIADGAYEQAQEALNKWNIKRFLKFNALANASAVAAGLVADRIDPELLPDGQQGMLDLIVGEAFDLVDDTSEARRQMHQAGLQMNPAESAAEWEQQLAEWEEQGYDFVKRFKIKAEKWMTNTFDLMTVARRGMNNDALADEKRLQLAKLVRSTSKVGAGLARALSNSEMAAEFTGAGREALEFMKFQKERVMPKGLRVRTVTKLSPLQRFELEQALRTLRAQVPREGVHPAEAATGQAKRRASQWVPSLGRRMSLEEIEAFLPEETE